MENPDVRAFADSGWRSLDRAPRAHHERRHVYVHIRRLKKKDAEIKDSRHCRICSCAQHCGFSEPVGRSVDTGYYRWAHTRPAKKTRRDAMGDGAHDNIILFGPQAVVTGVISMEISPNSDDECVGGVDRDILKIERARANWLLHANEGAGLVLAMGGMEGGSYR